MNRGVGDRIAALEVWFLRPPLTLLSDAELQARADSYLARMVAGADQDPELAGSARAVQNAPECQEAAQRLQAVLRASLAGAAAC